MSQESRTPPAPPASPHAAAARQLVFIHDHLRTCLATVRRHSSHDSADLTSLGSYVAGFGKFVLIHHGMEDTHLFPGLRRHGRLRSTDVAFLDGLAREHREVHGLTERMVTRAQSSADRAELGRLAAALEGLLLPHLATEEAGLSEARLREMIAAEDLLTMQRAAESSGGAQRDEVAKLFQHPLHPRGS